ncbi:MAG: serpin family protein [Candidatus Diapherotrites archaeon]
MKKAILALLFIGVALAGCPNTNPNNGDPTTPDPNNGNPIIPVEFSKMDDSGYTVQSVGTLAQGTNDFAFEMYNEINEEGKNVFISPWSLSSALGMTQEGARGNTLLEMQQVLNLPANDSERQSAFAHLFNSINSPNDAYQMSTANAIWADDSLQMLEGFVNTVKTYYGAEARELDFAQSAQATNTINTWVEDKTNDKIKDLIPPNTLSSDTRLVLTNAVYFKGTWQIQFDPKDTREEEFRTPDGTVMTDMMRITKNDDGFDYAEDELAQVLELPYKGDKLSMLILLPTEDSLSNLEESLNAQKINSYRNSLQKTELPIYIPKFKFEEKYFLKENLPNIGMIDAFSPNADFFGISDERLLISEVIHQSFVEVNEEGTEAAAATAVIMEKTSSIGDPTIFKADHPFIFAIIDKDSGMILFLGKVADPTKT